MQQFLCLGKWRVCASNILKAEQPSCSASHGPATPFYANPCCRGQAKPQITLTNAHLLPSLPLLLLQQQHKNCWLQDVKAHLPAQAHSLYYKDIIGNISSSDTTHTSKEVRRDQGQCSAVHTFCVQG
jgi:hypothetical protein